MQDLVSLRKPNLRHSVNAAVRNPTVRKKKEKQTLTSTNIKWK